MPEVSSMPTRTSRPHAMGSHARSSAAHDLVLRTMSSPVGELRLVASPTGLRSVLWANEEADLDDVVRADSKILDSAVRELTEYFAGERREFHTPLDPVGTPFQQSVWRVLSTIPFGHTMSYGDQARALGDARKARAVGAANGRNPIPIIVPCHRVIGSNGSLTGFAAGVGIKKILLDFERAQMA